MSMFVDKDFNFPNDFIEYNKLTLPKKQEVYNYVVNYAQLYYKSLSDSGKLKILNSKNITISSPTMNLDTAFIVSTNLQLGSGTITDAITDSGVLGANVVIQQGFGALPPVVNVNPQQILNQPANLPIQPAQQVQQNVGVGAAVAQNALANPPPQQQQPLKIYPPNRFLTPLLLFPPPNSSNRTQSQVIQEISNFIKEVVKQFYSDNEILRDINISDFEELYKELVVSSRRGRQAQGVRKFIDVYNNLKDVYEANYVVKYNDLIASGNWTNEPSLISPDYSTISLEQDLIKEYNNFILQRVSSSLPIYEQNIPSRIYRDYITPEYINLLATYNSYLNLPQIGISQSFNFDFNKLLLTARVPTKQPSQKIIPSGFTEVGVNAFFKKLETQLKSNYSDLMGEYIVQGAKKSSKLFMDKNYNFVVVQGDNRRVFKDVQEARLFCLRGAFEADEVQKQRAVGLLTNKLKQGLRVIPRTSV